MSDKVTIGLDYGTNSVRAVVVGAADGREIATFVWNYPHGEAGIILDPRDPNMARQHPRDYVEGAEACVHGALEQAAQTPGFSPDAVIGIGVDTTGSTPLPVDADGVPLAFQDAFDGNPHAMAYLWKDHTGHAEAEEITAKAREIRPQYLAKCGGTYSSEWLWAKVWQCLRAAPEVYAAAHSWYEIADWIPAFLTGTDHPSKIKRCVCAAGHKGMYHPEWGGYPDAEFIAALDPALVKYRETLPDTCHSIADRAGELTAEWAERLGVPEGIPVAIGAFDAHLGAVGSGVAPGVLVKALGTSGCDMLVAPLAQDVPDIPGICGIVPESILPGCHGLEAGQSAVGDIFNWFVNVMKAGSHEDLTAEAEKMRPGESGLLALDWHNGNRTILVDGRLTGGVIGMTLATRPAEVYRALIEATAFGARVIMDRFEEYGVQVERMVNCGGISVKNPMVMQIYADVMNRPMEISASAQACALGAAIAGAVAAGSAAGGYDNFTDACAAMARVRPEKFEPIPENVRVYKQLTQLYRRIHDAFGTREGGGDLYSVMKELLRIRDEARSAAQ